MSRWIPFCCAIAFVILAITSISTLAYFSYAAFDREATANTASIARDRPALAWLERYASPPLRARDVVPRGFIDVHVKDRWADDRWDDPREPGDEPGTTYALDGEFARVAYDPVDHVVVSRFYNRYKTPEGTIVRTAPQPPMTMPRTSGRTMRSVRGLAIGERAEALPRLGYPAARETTLYRLPGPCRKANPCAVLLLVQTGGGRITGLDFYRTYYYGPLPAPSPPSDDEPSAPY